MVSRRELLVHSAGVGAALAAGASSTLAQAPAKRMIVGCAAGRFAGYEIYENQRGVIAIDKPEVLGRQVSFRGYFATPVAYVFIVIFLALQGVDEMHLLNISVAPASQGRGHARQMLDKAVAHLR